MATPHLDVLRMVYYLGPRPQAISFQCHWHWLALRLVGNSFFSLLSHSLYFMSDLAGGSVTINSTDPFASPLIDPGYYTSPFDIAAMRQGIQIMFQYLTAPSWSGYVLSQFGSFANISPTTDDSTLDAYIRNNSGSTDHLVGTAAMSAKGANYGVVDPDLTVKGVEGLRVVDASVFVSYYFSVAEPSLRNDEAFRY